LSTPSLEYYGTGKRKTSVARVHLRPGAGDFHLNERNLDDYFGGTEALKQIVKQPFAITETMDKFDVVATIRGGGVCAQAGALRHGISRALIVADPNLRGELKRRGFLTRDPRVKERKKAGLKKARKRPQFSKR
jgi:small subunit ribosomal protein S9